MLLNFLLLLFLFTDLTFGPLLTYFHLGGTAVSRTSKEPTTAQPTRTRRHPLRGRSCTATVAFLWTPRVCRSSRARLRHRQVTHWHSHLHGGPSLRAKKYNSHHLSICCTQIGREHISEYKSSAYLALNYFLVMSFFLIHK